MMIGVADPAAARSHAPSARRPCSGAPAACARRRRSRRRRADRARRSCSAPCRRSACTRPGSRARRGRDRIEPRLQGLERFDEGFRIGAHAAEISRSAASTSSVAASPSGSSPRASACAFCAPFAAGQIGDELEQHVGRGAERHVVDQHLAQRLARDREIGGRVDARRCTASASAGSFCAKTPSDRRPRRSTPDAGRDRSRCAR